MNQQLCALLIHRDSSVFESLKGALSNLSIQTYSVATCKGAEAFISRYKPQIVFAESAVVDSSWMSARHMTETAEAPFNLIVVGAVPDTRVYLSAMERGAFDFIAPPFEHEPLEFVVRSAALNNHHRRKALARTPVN